MKHRTDQYKQKRHHSFNDNRHDSYRLMEKYSEPTICIDCGALFSNGRWNWNDLPNRAQHALCPACQRIKDNYPAGIIELSGPFLGKHYAEILKMIKNIQRKEISEHPLERILDMQETDEGITITTTGMHIARRMGDALFNAYKGKLNYHYDDENLIRVYWHR